MVHFPVTKISGTLESAQNNGHYVFQRFGAANPYRSFWLNKCSRGRDDFEDRRTSMISVGMWSDQFTIFLGSFLIFSNNSNVSEVVWKMKLVWRRCPGVS